MASAADVGSPSLVLSVAPALPGVWNRRRQEPVTAGVPLPQGFESDPGSLTLRAAAGAVPLQTRVLDRWPDGSIRWLLLDFFADWVSGVESTYVLALRSESSNIPAPVHSIAVIEEEDTGGVTIDTGVAQFLLSTKTFPFARVVAGGADVIDADRPRCRSSMAKRRLAGSSSRVSASTSEVRSGASPSRRARLSTTAAARWLS